MSNRAMSTKSKLRAQKIALKKAIVYGVLEATVDLIPKEQKTSKKQN
jgi:hypothetical protein